MTDYFATQLTGSKCAPYNCAAASGAMGLAAATADAVTLTADQFRAESGASCTPGEHSQSGGLFISDVIRVFEKHGERINYGETTNGTYTRWPPSTLVIRLENNQGAVLLGDYDALPLKWRASSTFLGDHSAWVHDYHISDGTLCWHDPLRHKPIRIPAIDAIAYWQKAGSPVRGYAGFVVIAPQLPDTGTEDEPMGPLMITSTVAAIVDPIEGRQLLRADATPGPTVSNIGPIPSPYEVQYGGGARARAIAVSSAGVLQLLFVRNTDCASIAPAPAAGDVKHDVRLEVDGNVVATVKV